MKHLFTCICLLGLITSVHGQTFTSFTSTDGLLSNNTLCLAKGADGSMWFGTQSGVSKYDGNDWTGYAKADYPGMADDNILSIYVNAAGETWIGTDFGASVLNEDAWTTYTTTDGLGNNKVLCIAEDKDGHTWFGTNSGATEYDGQNWTSYGTSDGLPFGGVNSITLHTDGTLWLGTGLGGVAIFDGSSFTEITEDDGLISDKIRAVDFDADGQIWVGTADGLSLLNSDKSHNTNYTRIYTLPGSDTLNPIEDVAVGGDGVVWAGVYVDYLVTEGGVCAYAAGQWHEFDVDDGLVGPVVRALEIDDDNNVWVATSSGITKISDHKLSIDQGVQPPVITVYPNPVKDELYVVIPNASADQLIELYDMSMQLVLNQRFIQSANLSVGHLPRGVYFMKIDGAVKRIVISD